MGDHSHRQLSDNVRAGRHGHERCEFGGLLLTPKEVVERKSVMNKKASAKPRPTHPGELLREEVMPAAELNQVQLAKALGVSRKTISEVVLEQRPITVDMAMRLGRYFGNGPNLWLNMQQAVDLWDAIHSHGRTYDRIKPLKRKAA